MAWRMASTACARGDNSGWAAEARDQALTGLSLVGCTMRPETPDVKLRLGLRSQWVCSGFVCTGSAVGSFAVGLQWVRSQWVFSGPGGTGGARAGTSGDNSGWAVCSGFPVGSFAVALQCVRLQWALVGPGGGRGPRRHVGEVLGRERELELRPQVQWQQELRAAAAALNIPNDTPY